MLKVGTAVLELETDIYRVLELVGSAVLELEIDISGEAELKIFTVFKKMDLTILM